MKAVIKWTTELVAAVRNPHATVFGELPKDVQEALKEVLDIEWRNGSGWTECPVPLWDVVFAYRAAPSWQPPAPPVEYEDAKVELDHGGLLVFRREGGARWCGFAAQVTEGFMGYVYGGGELSRELLFDSRGVVRIPDAVRFARESA